MFALLVAIFLLAILSVCSAVIFYYSNVELIWPMDVERFGSFGDFFGGILNPILSTLSLLAILIATLMQRKEVLLSRLEMKLTSEANLQQAIALRDQVDALRKREKRDLAFKMYDRWTGECMRKHRLAAWAKLNEINEHNRKMSIVKLRLNSYETYSHIIEIYIFIGDLLKLIELDELDGKIVTIIFHDTLKDWVQIINDLACCDDELELTDYDKELISWCYDIAQSCMDCQILRS
jgi:hypothetical protein